jgi:transcriptional regulator with XRE-family HTH domain
MEVIAMDKSTEREALILRKRRKELGLSQMDVALNAGIHLQHYQNFEYGTRQFSKSTAILVLRICAVLELDPYEVVFGTSKDWIRRIR